MLELPEKLASERLPRRSIPGTARPATPAAVLSAIAKGLASKPYREHTYAEIFRTGLTSDPTSALMPERQAAFALLEALDETRVAQADEATLAVAEVMVNHLGRAGSAAPSRNEFASLAPLIAAVRDAPTAVRVFARANFLSVDSDGGYPTTVHVKALSTVAHYHVRTDRLLSLRHVLCAAEGASYAAARDVAGELRRAAPEWPRALIDCVFPDEPWANEDLASGLDAKAAISILVGAASDGRVLERYATEVSAHPIADAAFDLVSVLAPHESVSLFALALERTLAKPAYGPVHKTPPRRVAQALACLATEEATRVLVPYAAHPIVGALVVEHLRAHPELASVSAARGKSAAVVAQVLEKRRQMERADGADASTKTSTLPILRDRPWRKKVATDAPPLTLAVKGDERAFVDAEVLAARFTPRDHWPSRPMTDAERAAYLVETKGARPFAVDRSFNRAAQGYEHLEVPAELGLALFNEGKGFVSGGHAAWVRKHGLAALPGFAGVDWLRSLQYDLELETFAAVRALVSPRIAPAIARAAQRKRVRRVALAWLVKHAEIAALGLVPVALGPASPARRDAELALVTLSRGAQEAAVRAAAAEYGPEAAARIDALLARDPLALGASAPKPPSFLHAGELPPVRTRTGEVLDGDAVAALLELLQVAPIEPRYPGIDTVAEACEPESLGAFARELVEQWVLGDAPGRAEWMLEAAVWFPSPAGETRLIELARAFAQKNAAKAGRVAAALSRLGTDAALMHLAHIAETSRMDALRKDVAGLVADVAAARGLTADELADRTVPDAGLGADGTLTLAVGERTFVLSLSGALALTVRERADDGSLGAPTTSLPRPRKTDDAQDFAAARATWKRLGAEVAAVIERQGRRLERAMVSGRTWDAATFDARIVRHPILGALARTIVWECAEPSAAGSPWFRIAEDGTFTDGADLPFVLPDDARVRVAHPARGSLAAFASLFGDYRIVQPFDQLGRVGAVASHPSRRAATIDVAHVAPAIKIMGTLESRGWAREDAGFIGGYGRDFGGVRVRIPLSPGFSVDALAHATPQTLGTVTLTAEGGAAATLAALDDVAFFELTRDLDALRRLS